MVKPAGKESRSVEGKQRIVIEYIKDKEKRQVTFSKRKGGLLKKASELHLLCGAHVALVIFSQKQQGVNPDPADVAAAAARAAGGRRASSVAKRNRGGNVFAMGTPSVDHVLSLLATGAGGDPYGRNHAAAAVAGGRDGAEATARRRDEAKELVDAEGERMRAIADKVRLATAVGRFWWEAYMAALGEAELPAFGGALRRLRDNVLRRHADNWCLGTSVRADTKLILVISIHD